MSATVLPFPPRRRWEPRVLFSVYTPPAGSLVTVAEGSLGGETTFDVGVVEPGGDFALVSMCNDRDDAEHIAKRLRAEMRRR